MKELKGIITAMVTPFDETEKMDITAAKKMARWLVDNGVHGLFICGTNGEFHLLSDDEKVELTKAWICPYISRHLLSLNPSLAHCRRYSRGER